MVMIRLNSAKITGKDFDVSTSGSFYVMSLPGASRQKRTKNEILNVCPIAP